MSKLNVQMFGGLRVCSDEGEPIVIPAKKAQALLAYLARYPGRQHSRDKIAALLWEDSDEVQARASVRQALTVIRRALGFGECHLITGAGDAIALPADRASVDVQEFETLLDRNTADAWERAIAIYQGEFLEAFNAKSRAFEEWLTVERQRLRERAVGAMSKLLARDMAAGATERAIDTAVRLLSLDPFQEPVHRSLMSLYARQGREASALRQFQLCRSILQRELGAEPDFETQQLYKNIQQQRRTRPKTAAIGSAAGSDFGRVDDRAQAETHSGSRAGPVLLDNEADKETASGAPTELRQMTTIFAEMADMTRVGDQVDPEEVKSLSDAFAESVRGIVESYGGAFDRHLTGGVLAHFGAPLAHTNDAERAVRAAIRIRAVTPSLNRDGISLGVQIGIAGGPMLVTHTLSGQNVAVTGTVPGLAARLAAAANANEILLADSVFQMLSRQIGRAEPRTLALPAIREPVAAWQLLELRDRSAAAPQSAFVGRRAELSQFAAALVACRETGRGQSIYVRGEAGIGKTRLVEEFRQAAQAEGFACHAGQVLNFGGGTGQDAIRLVVSGLLELFVEDEAAAHAAIDHAVVQGAIERDQRAYLYDLLRVQQPPALRTLYEAMDNQTRSQAACDTLAAVVRHRSIREPQMIVLEDVHWAEPLTLNQAAALAAAVQECPTILVITARAEGDPLNAIWRGMTGGSGLITMDLGPLRREETVALATELAGAADPFTMHCIERSGGNPLFLEQLLHAGESAADDLPGSVQTVVLARMDQLEPHDRHALQVASVFGQYVPAAALRHLISRPEYDCGGLLQQGLLRPRNSDYWFAHALVQEGVYSSLLKSRRRELHVRAAEWFAEREATLRAEHLDRADDPDAPKAYLQAARGQAAEYRFERALQLAERGLALVNEPSLRFDLLCCRAEVLQDLGASAESQAAYEATLAAARTEAEHCRAWLGLATAKRVTDDLNGALTDVLRAEESAERLGLTVDAARAHFLHGNLLYPRGDFVGCLREHQRSLDLARRAGTVELEAAALGGIGDTELMRGRMITAYQYFTRCVDLCLQHSLRRIEVSNRAMAGVARMFFEDARQVRVDALAAIECAREVRQLRAELLAQTAACWSCYQLLDFDAAWGHADKMLNISRNIRAPRFEADALSYIGELHRQAGRRQEALANLHAALAIRRTFEMGYGGATVLGLLALAADDPKERDGALAEAEEHLRKSIALSHFAFRMAAIDACLASGLWERAIRHADSLEKFTRAEPLPWATFLVARGRALAAYGLGKRDRALVAEMKRLRLEGQRLGFLIALPDIETALRELPADESVCAAAGTVRSAG